MKIIVLVGIPGVGKTSILQEVVRQIPMISVENYGDHMLKEAALEGITRDCLRKLSFKDQQQIGVRAAQKMREQQRENVVIVDTHALIRTDFGYCPGLPMKVLDILSPKACAWVDCQPSIILQRRAKDHIRKRDIETEEELAIHQELTRSFITACSMHTGSLLCRIQNSSPSLEENVLPFIRLIQSL